MAIKRENVHRNYRPDETVVIKIDPMLVKLGLLYETLNQRLADYNNPKIRLQFAKKNFDGLHWCFTYRILPIENHSDAWKVERQKYASRSKATT